MGFQLSVGFLPRWVLHCLNASVSPWLLCLSLCRDQPWNKSLPIKSWPASPAKSDLHSLQKSPPFKNWEFLAEELIHGMASLLPKPRHQPCLNASIMPLSRF